jgi:adenylate cyclase
MPRILIVDDETNNLAALKRALQDENPNWKILTASNEKEGKSILKRQMYRNRPVDVVLTDLVMECESSGMNLLSEARRIDPLIMAIIFTAKEKSLDRYAALNKGAFDVVEKNIRGAFAVDEINIKTRAAIGYRDWSQRINILRKYFDPHVFEAIENDPSILSLSRRTITIVFWDIRGFSTLCENLKAHPELIAGFLRDYCENGAKIIFKRNGVLDKFIGDGIMALFGILQSKNNEGESSDAINAVHAAMEMRSKFEDIRNEWTEKWNEKVPNKIDIGLGCGIHTGEVLVGNVGTNFRDQFTALGPHVNFASRIESKSKKSQILLSISTQKHIKNIFKATKVDEVSDIKNIPGTYELFEI